MSRIKSTKARNGRTVTDGASKPNAMLLASCGVAEIGQGYWGLLEAERWATEQANKQANAATAEKWLFDESRYQWEAELARDKARFLHESASYRQPRSARGALFLVMLAYDDAVRMAGTESRAERLRMSRRIARLAFAVKHWLVDAFEISSYRMGGEVLMNTYDDPARMLNETVDRARSPDGRGETLRLDATP